MHPILAGLLLALASTLLPAAVALAHSGGLDDRGCHNESATG